jgi:flagellar assembly protein FliH
MNSFKRDVGARQVPAPSNARAPSFARFIPREELQDFTLWTPEAFGDPGLAAEPHPSGALSPEPAGRAGAAKPGSAAAEAPATALPTPAEQMAEMQAEMDRQVTAARAQGYQDGYRDGLVALDSFKQSFASQVSAQMGQVLASLEQELSSLEQTLASSVARVATELARQVVRSELTVRPALVAQVAREAINAVLMSASHITVMVHPDDHALVTADCQEALAARGARLLAQPSVERGGCKVESDAGVVDARIGARWAQATHALGTHVPWDDATPAEAST